MGFLNVGKLSGADAGFVKTQKTETVQEAKINSILAKPSNELAPINNYYKVVKVETVVENGKKVETAYNCEGKVLRTSVFVDRNADGNFDRSEAVSIKFNHVVSRSCETKEYKDLNNDGYYDEIIESDWSGMETIKKINNKIKPENRKMSDVYGSENDTSKVWSSNS